MSLVPRLRLPVLLLASLCGAMPVVAEEAGLDWRPVQARDSKLRITLADMAEHARYFRAQTPNYSANLFIARVPTTEFRGDRVSAIYVELQPGFYFPDRYDVDDVLAAKVLRDAGLRETDRFALVAGGGRYDIVTFSIHGDILCAAFARTWGSFGGDQVGSGSRRLYGYGCEERGKPLGRDRIKEALESLEVAD